jgi:glycerophosphoryl diester phosphodiesterase
VDKIPLIITHRGDRKNGIENTTHSIQLAIDQGANAIETDIRQTGTGEIVVFHDFSLRRMFNKPGYIGKSSFSDLQKYPYINNIDNNEYFIETLDSFLDKFGKSYPVNLDAKTIHFFDFKFADKIISIVRNHNLFDSVWISCFNPFLLQILKYLNKQIRTGYLFQRTPWIHTTYDLISYTDAWHPNHRVLSERLVKKAQKYNKKLFVWTVNEDEVIQKILQFPVDGIITDNVPQVKHWLELNPK